MQRALAVAALGLSMLVMPATPAAGQETPATQPQSPVLPPIPPIPPPPPTKRQPAPPPAPVEDTPREPVPTEPEPIEPAPSEPAPIQPAPIDAEPEQAPPAPESPAPVEVAPMEPLLLPDAPASAPDMTSPVPRDEKLPADQVKPVPATSPTSFPPKVDLSAAPTTQPRAATGPATTRTTAAAQSEAEQEPQFLSAALAERLATLARAVLYSPELTAAHWKYATALLEGAARLNPYEQRFAWFLVEASLRAGDTERAVKALTSYRQLRPDDHHAQCQQIDLYLGRMNDASQKTQYLEGVIASPAVHPLVKSFAAVRSVGLLAERMQSDEAWKMVDKALELNPLNLEAIRMKYQLLEKMGPEHELAGLLAMLRANPAQPSLAAEVARRLGDAGLVHRSIEWFNQSADLFGRMGMRLPGDVGIDYAAQLFISGDSRRAAALAEQLTKLDPDDVDAWQMRLIVAKAQGNKEEVAGLVRQSQVALSNRFAKVRQAAGDKAATTRPIDAGDVPLPDPAGEVKYLQSAAPEMVQSHFAPLAGAAAWLKVYFSDNAAEAAPWIKALASVAGEDDVTVARLQGWALLAGGNKDEAEVKLSAVADRDPVAQLGLVRLMEQDPQEKNKVAAKAKELLEARPSGLTGALIAEALAKLDLRRQPSAEGAALEKVLATYPRDWFKVIEQPNLFYALRIEPVRASVPVGEPILVQVTVQNIREYPLTFGPDGVIHPDLWLDAQLKGIAPQVFPAEAYGRLVGPLVLMPRESVTQVVRLDQNRLQQYLDSRPTASIQLAARAMTNPITIGGRVAKGPAGQEAGSRLFERNGVAIQQEAVRQRLSVELDTGSPDAKIRAIEVMARFVPLLIGSESTDESKQLAQMFYESLQRSGRDDDPLVRGWANYRHALLSPQPERPIRAMIEDPVWVTRVLGIIAAELREQDRSLFKSLAEADKDEVVKQLAAAGLVIELRPPSTQPTTQEAVQPVTAAPLGIPAEVGGKPAGSAGGLGPITPLMPIPPAQPAGATQPASQ